jgi:hypothetical protein
MHAKVGSTTINMRSFLGAVAIATFVLATSSRVQAQGWPSYGHDPQHSCMAVAGSLVPQQARWSYPLDQTELNNMGGTLYIHYGTPVITRLNTVIASVQTSTSGGVYGVTALNTAGGVVWSATSDYTLPSHDWVPIFGITLTPRDQYLVYPGAGGTIYVRNYPDYSQIKYPTVVKTSQYAFFGNANYAANPAAFKSAIQICTPISSDALGNLYFGYTSNNAALPGYPNGIGGGLAKVSNTGVGSFVQANTMTPNTSMNKVAYNCAPAFSADGNSVFVAINNGGGTGYLCAINTTTLATNAYTTLIDPSNGANATVDDDGSATPTVGPDGDVYYGVLGSSISNNHYRGFLLHFGYSYNSSTQQYAFTSKLPSAFGWDDTAAIVPASAVPSYTGSSTYLLLTKYNNYGGGAGGTGINQVAVVDPTTSFVDPISGVTTMKPVIAVTGVTPDPGNGPNAVREWCINSAAIDTVNKCAVINSEDGHVYRWSFITNSLSSGLKLEPATSEAYTPTLIGPDGAVYAINNAYLFCCIGPPN